MQFNFHSLLQLCMQQKNKWRALLALLVLMLISLIWHPMPAFAQETNFSRTPWQINRGGGIIDLGTVLPTHGHPDLYGYMRIPAVNDAGWTTPPLDLNGNIFFSEPSALAGKTCQGWADFTYFQTLVTIPAGASIATFQVNFQQVDDGARAYIFNSRYPDGAYISGGDIVFNGSPVTADLSSLVAIGETNRVVIVQADDCPDENNLRNAQLYVNGTLAVEEPDPEEVLADQISNATNVVWSPNSARVAILSADGTVVVWKVNPAAIVTTFEPSAAGAITTVTWSPNGSRLAAVTESSVIVWDVETTEVVSTLESVDAATITSVTWSPNGSRLATVTTSSVVVWDVETAVVVSTFELGNAGSVTSVIWSPNGSRLAAATTTRSVVFWNVETAEQITTIFVELDASVTNVSWSPNGTDVAVVTTTSVTVWNIATETVVTTIPLEPGTSVTWSPDGTNVAVVTTTRVVIWNIATETIVTTIPLEPGTSVTTVTWSPNGTDVAVVTTTRVVIWNIATETVVTTIPLEPGTSVTTVTWSPNGTDVAVVTTTRVVIWNIATETIVTTISLEPGTSVTTVTWSPNGTDVAVVTTTSVVVWNIATETIVTTISLEPGTSITTVTWSLNGTDVAVVTTTSVVVWNIATETVVTTIPLEPGTSITTVTWSPNGTDVAVVTTTSVVVWNIATETVVTTISLEPGTSITTVTWSPNGTDVAFVTTTSVVVWNIATETVVTTIPITPGTRVTTITWKRTGEVTVVVEPIVPGVEISPTATNTPLPTATPTSTPTNTPVPTATPTNTPLPTATPTNTPTDTPVPTATATNTPLPTATSTDTPVPTATNTPEPTATPTSTPTDTPVPTATATNTPEPTATPTSTLTDTPVPTATATNTPLPTATATSTPTDTPVPTATATNTPEPTATATSTPTDTPVPTATATNTPEPTATPTDTPKPTATATNKPKPAATATNKPKPVATATNKPKATATNRPKPVATATNKPKPTVTATTPATGGSGNGNVLCADIPAPIDADAVVRFVNNSGSVGYLYWIDADGAWVAYAILESGDVYDQETFVGHQWEMYDVNPQAVDEPGTHLMLRYTVTADTKQCVLIERATESNAGSDGTDSGNTGAVDTSKLCADLPLPTTSDALVRFVNGGNRPVFVSVSGDQPQEPQRLAGGETLDLEMSEGDTWTVEDEEGKVLESQTVPGRVLQCVGIAAASESTGSGSGSDADSAAGGESDTTTDGSANTGGSGASGKEAAGSTSKAAGTTGSGGKVAIVNAASLNVRSGPGATYQIVGKVIQGQVLPVLDEDASGWVQVEIPNGTGWVSVDFVRIDADAGTTGGGSGSTTGGTTSGTTSDSGARPLTFESLGNWQRGAQSYGTFTLSAGGGQDGGSAGELKYDFTGATSDNDFVVFTQRVAIAGEPNVLRAFVKGDASGHLFNIWIEDAKGEVWSVPMGAVTHTGWQQMTGIIDANAPWPGGYVYGPEDGVIDYPIWFLGLVIDRTDGPTTGTILFDDIAPVSDPSAALAQPEAATDTTTAVPDLCADISIPEAGYELTVRFANAAKAPVVIFWVNFEDQLVEVARLSPGELHDENSFVAHHWVIQDESGTVLGEYTNTDAQMQCVQIS